VRRERARVEFLGYFVLLFVLALSAAKVKKG